MLQNEYSANDNVMVIRNYARINQTHRQFILTYMDAKTLSDISYTAVRGVDDEVGAVQRILIERRIKGIKEFILSGGDFPAAIVLNWVDAKLQEQDGIINFNVESRLAQIIDGQHRVAGLKAAIKENKIIGVLKIPVVIYENLSTKECADIFLAINTEQKPAPRSLVYDLYGVGSDSTIDPAASRARDIAEDLNKDIDSPYYSKIKFPGEKRRKGGIALSTVVSAIKPLIEDKAIFEQIGITELSLQTKCFHNFFTALYEEYEDEWELKNNVFQYAAGFSAACEFYMLKLIPYCSHKKSFETKTISDVLNIRQNGLIRQDEVTKKSGKEAVRIIIERLDKSFSPEKEDMVMKF